MIGSLLLKEDKHHLPQPICSLDLKLSTRTAEILYEKGFSKEACYNYQLVYEMQTQQY